ncbi:MAG: hypothetical protein Q4C84_09970 [Bacillota bacterium]|nr:hypothetical protein [Bacillota bacterium]
MDKGNNGLTVNRTFKSRIFAMLYRDKKELLDLYNAVTGKHYENPDELEINTLENAIYMSMQNDVSFLIDSRLSLYEHQSTYNPNLPLRFLFYVSDIYSALTKEAHLYGTKVIPIPTPNFLIFYNGEEEMPDRQILKLSNAYTLLDGTPKLELEAVMLNINPGHNQELLSTCKSLHDYSEYTARVRRYSKEMEIEDAVERAICECIEEGILSEFLSQNRMEAKSMSIYEYDAEKHIRQEREDAWEDGIETGISETSILIAKLAENGDLAQLEELGKTPDGLKALLKKYNISR